MDNIYIKFTLPNKLMENVEYWYLELDSSHRPSREIGFDINKKPIVYYPNKDLPHGFLSDSPISLNPDDWDHIEQEVFETIWEKKDVA